MACRTRSVVRHTSLRRLTWSLAFLAVSVARLESRVFMSNHEQVGEGCRGGVCPSSDFPRSVSNRFVCSDDAAAAMVVTLT